MISSRCAEGQPGLSESVVLRRRAASGGVMGVGRRVRPADADGSMPTSCTRAAYEASSSPSSCWTRAFDGGRHDAAREVATPGGGEPPAEHRAVTGPRDAVLGFPVLEGVTRQVDGAPDRVERLVLGRRADVLSAGLVASIREILFAPPSMVGQRNWMPSSSQKQTGQIS